MTHCWTGRREWIVETYGYRSDEYVSDAERPGATCMLPDGHAGPHAFTDDDKIRISFAQTPATSADASTP